MFGMYLVYVFDATIQCLLIVIVTWVTCFIKILNLRLVDARSTNSKTSDERFPVQLSEWKNQHSLICRFVDRFNDTFGFIVLLSIYYRFVSIIGYAFMVFSVITEEQDMFFIYYSFSNFFSESFKLCMIVYICHKLQCEV